MDFVKLYFAFRTFHKIHITQNPVSNVGSIFFGVYVMLSIFSKFYVIAFFVIWPGLAFALF